MANPISVGALDSVLNPPSGTAPARDKPVKIKIWETRQELEFLGTAYERDSLGEIQAVTLFVADPTLTK